VVDLTCNLHHHGEQWLRHPAAYAAMEAFLLSGLGLLQADDGLKAEVAAPLERRDLARALDYIHAHAHENPTLAEIAAAACISPRTLEGAFQRRYDVSPLAYARGLRLDRVHAALRALAGARPRARRAR